MQWLSQNGTCDGWVAIDDMDLWTAAGPAFRDHFVHTKPHFGITDADASQLVRLLSPGAQKNGVAKKAQANGISSFQVPPELVLASLGEAKPYRRKSGFMSLFFN